MFRPAYAISRSCVYLLFRPLVRWHVVRAEQSALSGGWILAANHISHFDPALLTIVNRRPVDWMAMAELFEQRHFGAWLRAAGTFPVSRDRVDRQAVRTALERLKAGAVVGVFPEGGIRDGAHSILEGANGRPGIGAVSQLSGCPVVPCVVVGSDQLYAHRAWIPFWRTSVWIAYGEPLACPAAGKPAREAFEQLLHERMRDLYSELKERFGLSAADLPQPPMRRKGRC